MLSSCCDALCSYFDAPFQDGSGTIDHTEVLRLLERTASPDVSAAANAKRVLEEHGLAKVDENGDGTLSLEEFEAAALKDERVLKMFGDVL